MKFIFNSLLILIFLFHCKKKELNTDKDSKPKDSITISSTDDENKEIKPFDPIGKFDANPPGDHGSISTMIFCENKNFYYIDHSSQWEGKNCDETTKGTWERKEFELTISEKEKCDCKNNCASVKKTWAYKPYLKLGEGWSAMYQEKPECLFFEGYCRVTTNPTTEECNQ